jgi:hypothetical protein
MVDRSLGIHHLIERSTILIAMAELKSRARAGNVDVLIVCQPIKLPRECILARRLEHRSRGIHEQLQRCQTLLTVDDAAGLHITKNRFPRLDHDRPEEVLRVDGRLIQPEIRQPPDVLPQRRPLLVFLPDIRTLERRHHKVLRLHKDVLRRTDMGFHQAARRAAWAWIPVRSPIGRPSIAQQPTGDIPCHVRVGSRLDNRDRSEPP